MLALRVPAPWAGEPLALQVMIRLRHKGEENELTRVDQAALMIFRSPSGCPSSASASSPTAPVATEGDALARFRILESEIRQSLRIADQLVGAWRDGDHLAKCCCAATVPIYEGWGAGTSEAARNPVAIVEYKPTNCMGR